MNPITTDATKHNNHTEPKIGIASATKIQNAIGATITLLTTLSSGRGLTPALPNGLHAEICTLQERLKNLHEDMQVHTIRERAVRILQVWRERLEKDSTAKIHEAELEYLDLFFHHNLDTQIPEEVSSTTLNATKVYCPESTATQDEATSEQPQGMSIGRLFDILCRNEATDPLPAAPPEGDSPS